MEPTESTPLAAILFAELADPGPLTQRDDPIGLELIEEHQQILRDIFPMFQGQEIKSAVGGLFVEFGSALSAVQCAVEIQRTLAERNEKKSEERQIQIRIGIDLSNAAVPGDDAPADAASIAAQMASRSEPGGICVTGRICEQIEGGVPQPCVPVGGQNLESVSSKETVYRLVLDATPEMLATAVSSRKQLYWVVLGVLVLNLVLFLKFGLNRRTAPTTGSTTTNPPMAAGLTNSN